MSREEILIISSKNDKSSFNVLMNLKRLGKNGIRLSFQDHFLSKEIYSDLNVPNLTDVKVGWYRRDLDYIIYYFSKFDFSVNHGTTNLDSLNIHKLKKIKSIWIS